MAISDYSQKYSDLDVLPNMRNAIMKEDSTINYMSQLGMYYFFDSLGNKSIITPHEFKRKADLGYEIAESGKDTTPSKEEKKTGDYVVMAPFLSSWVIQGNISQTSLFAGKDTTTHDPYDERLKLYVDSLRLWEKYSADDGQPSLWSNIRHIAPDKIKDASDVIGFGNILPTAIAVYDIKVDTIVLTFFHTYFKKPTKVIYALPCMFPNTIDEEPATPLVTSGRGQYVYYDKQGFPKPITKDDYKRHGYIGTRQLFDVHSEYVKNKQK